METSGLIPFHSADFRGMPYRRLGASGLSVSAVGLGTWKMGYPGSGDQSTIDEKTSFDILDQAVAAGITFWDTANRYNNGSGNSERIIGAWLRNHPAERRNIVLATKLGGLMDGRTPNHCGLSRANILSSVYASLERLKVDYIDLLYFHAFDPGTPAAESLEAVEDLVRRDLVRYFGVSNFSVEHMEAFGQCTDGNLHSRNRITVVQNQFDVVGGEFPKHKGVLDYARARGISFVAWSPLRRGLLSGKYFEREQEDSATVEKIQALSLLACSWNMELPQLVLAYMLGMPGMGPVIPAASTVTQLRSNAFAAGIRFDDYQRSKILEILSPANRTF